MKNKPRVADLRPLLENGYRLLPLHRPFEKRRDKKGVLRKIGKAPIDKRWTAKTYEARKVVKQYGGINNIGIQLRDTDLILDIDVRHGGKEGLRKLRTACPDWSFENSVRAVTGGGGLHIFLTKPADLKPVTSLPEFHGVEFKTKGTQIVAPGSVHPDTKKYYHWHELSAPLADVQPAPKSLLKIIKRPPPPENAPDAGEVEPERLAAMLEHLKPEDYNTNDTWLPIMFACHQATAGNGRQEFIEWSIQDPAFADNEIEIGARWDSSDANEPGGVTARSLYKELIDAGCPAKLIPGMTPDSNEVFTDEGLQETLASLPDASDDGEETESESESECADDTPGENIAGLTITRASDVEQRDYEWLWKNRFAIGHLHALFGLPGQGKGMLMCEIASILSRGTAWPDQSGKAPQAQCVILTAEDSAKESLAPRLQAAGADLDQVLFMNATVTETKKQKAKRKNGKRKPATVFNIGADLKRLSQVVKRHPNIKVLFIDPIGSFIGNGKQTDSYKSAEVRAILTPITEWADRRRICVIYISHANKSGTGRALNRMTDSQAFGAAPRFVWIVGPDPLQPDSGQKVFASAKTNIAKEVSALSFRIDDCEIKIDGKKTTRGKVHWIGESNATADQIVASPSQERPSAMEAAETFLADLIANNGPMKQADIQEKAEGLYSWRTIRRAQKSLGIIPKKEVGVPNGSWIWDFTYTDGEAESETL